MMSIKLELPAKKKCRKCEAEYCSSPAGKQDFTALLIMSSICFECFEKWLKENFGTMEKIED